MLNQSDSIEYLEGRLSELESVTDNLTFMLANEDSALYNDELAKTQLSNMLFESAAIRRKLAGLK